MKVKDLWLLNILDEMIGLELKVLNGYMKMQKQ